MFRAMQHGSPAQRAAQAAFGVRSPLPAASRMSSQLHDNRSVHSLTPKIDKFIADVEQHVPDNGKGCLFASAWLVTDNVFVALMHKYAPSKLDNLTLGGIDTLHLFPETHQVADDVQRLYQKRAVIYKPHGCETKEDFVAEYGDCEELTTADFDYASKVAPFQRLLQEYNKNLLITGRRFDQGNERIQLDVFEADKRVFNPFAHWSWEDITTCVDEYKVAYNRLHEMTYRSQQEIPASDRHLPQDWVQVDMGVPCWRATAQQISGKPPSPVAYVYKSFGDTHTTVPVGADESERAGRFVRQKGKTECGIHTRATSEGSPHGGVLVDLHVRDEGLRKELLAACKQTIELTDRQVCDVIMLVSGGFSPLRGFMTEECYTHVVEQMRLPELQLFGLPVTLDVQDGSKYAPGDHVLLTYKGETAAVLEVEQVYKPDKRKEAALCYLTDSDEHPNVDLLCNQTGAFYLGGNVHGIDRVSRDAVGFTYSTPREVRNELPKSKPVVAFQCRNPIHRAHFELLRRANEQIKDSTILVHPTCGPTQPDDIDGLTRIATYEVLQEELGSQYPRFRWAYLPYSMKLAGPREAIQHMIIRKNFGATEFIIGRDMAGTKSTKTGEDFYGAYDAQEMGKKHSDELGIKVAVFENMLYCGPEHGYAPESEVAAKGWGSDVQKLSGTKFRKMLRAGEDIPEWFAFPSVVKALRAAPTSTVA